MQLHALPIVLLALFHSFSSADDDDERMVLGVQTVAIKDVPERNKEKLLGTRSPKVGVVVLTKDPGCETEFLPFDVITHLDRQVIKSNEDLNAAVVAIDDDKKHRITYQRSLNGKWFKGDVDFKPKPYKQLVMANLAFDKDAVTDSITFRDKRSPDSPAQTNVQCRIRETKSGESALLIRFSYGGDDWIFFTDCLVKIDGESTELKFTDVKHENKGRRVWEWCTRVAKAEDTRLLQAMSKGKSVTLRFIGKYTHDHELTAEEQIAIANVLEALRLRARK